MVEDRRQQSTLERQEAATEKLTASFLEQLQSREARVGSPALIALSDLHLLQKAKHDHAEACQDLTMRDPQRRMMREELALGRIQAREDIIADNRVRIPEYSGRYHSFNYLADQAKTTAAHSGLDGSLIVRQALTNAVECLLGGRPTNFLYGKR